MSIPGTSLDCGHHNVDDFLLLASEQLQLVEYMTWPLHSGMLHLNVEPDGHVNTNNELDQKSQFQDILLRQSMLTNPHPACSACSCQPSAMVARAYL